MLTPKPFQLVGAAHLRARSAILTDKPGLGKTIQAIWANKDTRGPILVITTTRNKLFWMGEIMAVLGDNENITVAGVAGRFDIAGFKSDSGRRWVITHWAALHQKGANVLMDIPWETCIVDEAHHMKNVDTKQSTFVRSLHAAYFHFLTASPMEKSAADMWPMLFKCDPQFKSYHKFVNDWCVTETRWVGRGKSVQVITGTRDAAKFAKFVEPWVLGRLKVDVAPAIATFQHIMVPLPFNGLAKDYERLERETLIEMSKEPQGKLYIANQLARMTRLQQFISHPPIFGVKARSPKDEWLQEFLEGTGDEPVLIFCRFRMTAQFLSTLCPGGLAVMGGSTWLGWSKGVRYICTTYGTINEGSNLDKTLDGRDVSTVVKYDQQWSTIIEEQAGDRIHRLNTVLPVTEYSMRIEGSIDDYIIDTREAKMTGVAMVQNFIRKLKEKYDH